jgi:hypothetical protein
MNFHRVGFGALVLLVFLSGTAAADYRVVFEYYVYATNSDGIPISGDENWPSETYAEGAFTHTGDYGNYGAASFEIDMFDRSVTAAAHSHGVQVSTYTFGVGTGRVENASFYDRISFHVEAGAHPDGLYATMTGTMRGTIGSAVGAGAQGRCIAELGTESHDTGLLATGIEESRTIQVDEDFTLILELVPPGKNLGTPADYVHHVRLGFWNGRTSSVEYNTGSGYVTGDANIDFTDGLRITSLTASPGVTWTSESGAFSDGVTGVPEAAELQLHQNVPNPFNPQTAISFSLGLTGHARVAVYDLAGRRIALLTDETFAAGTHAVTWNGRDSRGRAMPSGSYLIRLETAEGVESRSVMLVR